LFSGMEQFTPPPLALPLLPMGGQTGKRPELDGSDGEIMETNALDEPAHLGARPGRTEREREAEDVGLECCSPRRRPPRAARHRGCRRRAPVPATHGAVRWVSTPSNPTAGGRGAPRGRHAGRCGSRNSNENHRTARPDPPPAPKTKIRRRKSRGGNSRAEGAEIAENPRAEPTPHCAARRGDERHAAALTGARGAPGRRVRRRPPRRGRAAAAPPRAPPASPP